MIALATLIDPNFYQRCFAAKDFKIAKKGIIISTVIWVLFDICTTAGAMYARAVIPETESNIAYLTYAVQLLPHGLRGFFLAGILATILSTLDSYIFLAGTTLSYDLLPKKLRHNLKSHYLGIISVGFFSILLASYFDGNIKLVWKTIGSYFSACLLVPVLFGHFFPGKVSDKNFVITVIFGIIATTYWKAAEHRGFWTNVDEIYIGTLATAIPLTLLLFFRYNTSKY
jgi:SSS family solute:Na+ symporter